MDHGEGAARQIGTPLDVNAEIQSGGTCAFALMLCTDVSIPRTFRRGAGLNSERFGWRGPRRFWHGAHLNFAGDIRRCHNILTVVKIE